MSFPGMGPRIEHDVKPLKIGLTTINFTLADALKYFEGQGNVEEFCKTTIEVRDNIMDLSSKEMQALRNE